MDFDRLKENVILKNDIKYYDFAASGLAYKPIEDEILRILQTYANTHSSVESSNAAITSEYYDRAREKMKDLLGVGEKFHLISCGFGASAAIKKLWEILGIYISPYTKSRLNLNFNDFKKPLFIISPYEHHSVEVSLRNAICDVIRVPLDGNGLINFQALKEILSQNLGREIYGVFSAASNVTGIIVDYKKAYLLFKMHMGHFFIDATAFISHCDIDFDFCDGAFFSGHKFLGGVGGSGVLILKKEFFNQDTPIFGGGGTVEYVNRTSQRFIADTQRLEEAGTPGITAFIKTYLAVELRNKIGLDEILKRDKEIVEKFLYLTNKIDEIEIYGNTEVSRLPYFAFNIKNLDPFAFSAIASKKFGLQTRSGCDCAAPYGCDLLGISDDSNIKPAWVRASFGPIHDESDAEYLINVIKEVIKIKDKIKLTANGYRC